MRIPGTFCFYIQKSLLNMEKITTFFAAICIFWASSCTSCKDKNCPDYLFYRIPYSLHPMKDTFTVGDTLWLTMDFSEELIDERGNIKNTFQNYDFRMGIGCERIDIDPPLAHTLDYLRIFTLIGTDSSIFLPSSGVSLFTFVPDYTDKKYVFKCALVIQEKGLFYFGAGPSEGLGEAFTIDGECENMPLEIGSKLVDEANNNFYMLQWASNSAYHSLSLDRFRNYGGYCFVVK